MKAQNTVLVCVTPQESSRTLVEAGRVLAEKNQAALEVISVLPISANFSKNEPATLEKLFSFAQNAGGQMAVYFSDDPVLTVAAHISKEPSHAACDGLPGRRQQRVRIRAASAGARRAGEHGVAGRQHL